MDNETPTKTRRLYHIVLIPARERRKIYNELKKEINEAIKATCKLKRAKIIYSITMDDSVRMHIELPTPSPLSISMLIKYIKWNSEKMLRRYLPTESITLNKRFWHTRCMISEEEYEEEAIRSYISRQHNMESAVSINSEILRDEYIKKLREWRKRKEAQRRKK